VRVTPSAASDRDLELARAALARPHSPFSALPPRLLLVDVERQRLALIEEGRTRAEYPVSTAGAGIGGREGSLQTPPGWHRIHARIGAGEPPGTVFESRIPTERVWRGEPGDEDLILTRILTLEGLEESVNRGAGVDSLERYIYVHGTNHPDSVGRPASHGCIRMRDPDLLALFDRVAEGDPLVVVEPVVSALPDPREAGRFHYAGIGGSGMSAIAQFQVMTGGRASGSERSFDRGDRAEARARLERMGIAILPQDGTGVQGDCAALVVSTAVEDQVPDVAAARARGLPIVHRSELLAHYVRTFRTIAVAGTSGKSTVTAMVFEILRAARRSPSVITGGDLRLLQAQGLWGNAWRGESDLLVIEADESDGSLVRYQPAIAVILNLQRDHREMDEVAALFERFRANARERAVVCEAPNLDAFGEGAIRFGFGPEADVRGEDVTLDGAHSAFTVDGVPFRLPIPGRHNVANALAAIAACRAVGVPLVEMVEALARYHGVDRRFQVLGRAREVEVVDDFAHNPAKLEAAIVTAQARVASAARDGGAAVGPGRVLAVYQPHGYGPTRFLRGDFVETFARVLRPEDRLWMLEVFYAGGTAQRDFSAADIVAEIAGRGGRAEFAESRQRLIARIAEEARAGDLVLVMGARDPSLTDLAQGILEALGAKPQGSTTGSAT
jgi:UDP-N-acetylmuramate--alanine ligase